MIDSIFDIKINQDLWDTILSEINETHKVQNKVMYDFNDEYNIFERCVLDIYNFFQRRKKSIHEEWASLFK